MMMSWRNLLLAGGLALSPFVASGEVPEPLTLQQALSFAASSHPTLQILQSQTEQATIALDQVESSQGVVVDLQGRIRWKRLQQQGSEAEHDNLLTLSARKPLYDFGRSELERQMATAVLDQKQLEHQQEIEMRKLVIMERYFDVLLADLKRTVEDETMTIAYLRFKKKEDKAHTGAYSELDLLEAESKYLDARAVQKQAEMAQRLTRIRLAEVMNEPESLPSTLIAPLSTPALLAEKLEPVEVIYKAAMQGNRQLRLLQQQIDLARQAVEKEKMGEKPELDAVVEWQDHSRVTSSKDRWRASLQLEVPLLDSGANQQRVAVAREALNQLQSQLEIKRREVRATIAQLHLQINALEAQWSADQIAEEYRDFELDRNRALYELERQSNFGDALVGVSSAHLRSAKSRFSAILARAKLDQLIGKEISFNE